MSNLADRPIEGGALKPVVIVNPASNPSQTQLGAGENHIGEVGGKLTFVTVEFTRENNATPYSAGDVISASAASPALLTFANFYRVAGGSAYLMGIRATVNVKSVTPRLRIHLFNASPVAANIAGDNLQHKELYADISKRLGYVDLPAMNTPADTVNSDISRSFDLSLRIPVTAAVGTRSIFALVETLDIVTLTALSKMTLVLVADNN